MPDLLFSTLYLPHRSHVEYEFSLSFSNLQLKHVKHIISFVDCFVICRIYLKQIMLTLTIPEIPMKIKCFGKSTTVDLVRECVQAG